MRYITYAILLFSFPAAAQTLQGVVTDANTHKPLFPVTVVNIITQQATYTNERGFYNITCNPGDVIAFSYIGYKTQEKAKPPSVIVTTLNIALERSSYQLDEFRLMPGHLTKYQQDSLERVSTYKRTLQRRPPNPIMSPVSAIAEKFSKKAKQAYQFQKNFAQGEQEKFIDTRYTPELVTELTGITGDSIGHFMYACPMPYDFARSATDLELKMWVRSNYRTWIKTYNADTMWGKQE